MVSSISDVPSEPGTYALWMHMTESQTIAVGHLGKAVFLAGTYGYVGSAFGPGGLRARLRRHIRGSGTRHWHVDYVRAIAEVRAVWYCATRTRLECSWSQTLAALAGTDVPMRGFGASDCDAGCRAHLVRLPADVALHDVREALIETTERGQVHMEDFGVPPNASTIQGWLNK